jgi:DNA-binding CsgD family transcriptional regulator
MNNNNIFDAIGVIYDCAADPENWHELLHPIRRLVQGNHAWAFVANPMDPSRCWLRDADGADTPRYAITDDPFYTSVQRSDVGIAVRSSRYVSATDIQKSPMYQILKSLDIAHCAVCVIERNEGSEHFIAFNRGSGDDFSAEHINSLKVLTPHLQRAYRLHTRMQSPFALPLRSTPSLDQSPTGVFLLDDKLTVRWQNESGEDIARENDGITVRNCQIQCCDPISWRAIASDLQSCRSGGAGLNGQVCSVSTVRRPSGNHPYYVAVTPLNPATTVFKYGCPASACVLIDDVDRHRTPSPLSLMASFDLTFSEASVAIDFATGSTLKQIASRRGTTVATVQTQFKRVLQKTELHTQAELTVMVHRIANVFTG